MSAVIRYSAAVTQRRKRILFLDDHVPYPELGVGYPRAQAILHALHDEGHVLTFVPLESPSDDWHALRRVVPHGVEVILGVSPLQLRSFLFSRSGQYDLIFVSRPNNMRSLLSVLEQMPVRLRSIPILYDAEAIFALREAARRAVENSPMSSEQQAWTLEQEMRLARAAKHVVAVNHAEAQIFRAARCNSVSVLGDSLILTPTAKTHHERKNLLFIGALDDDPSPNVDALVWFTRHVLPLVQNAINEPIRLVVAGRCGASRVRTLAGADVILHGKVDDLGPFYDAARVFIAPHRYAGGIPRKVLEAAARGVPCVISELLSKQLNWSHGVETLAASTAEEFAHSIVRLYSDEVLWNGIRNYALQAVGRDFSKSGFQAALTASLAQTMTVSESPTNGDSQSFFRRAVKHLCCETRGWIGRQQQHLKDRQRILTQARRIASSSWFDADWYRTVYPDVVTSGLDPALHYLVHGAPAGRDPGPSFSTTGYVRRYPEVGGINPLLHYLDVGAAEGRVVKVHGPQEKARRVICICGEPDSVGFVYRVLHLVKALAAAGAESSWMTIETAMGALPRIASANLVVLWRTAWDDSLARIVIAAKKGGAAILFDADDLIIEPELARIRIIDGIRTQGLTESAVETYYRRTLRSFEAADCVCTSTAELAAEMRRRDLPTFLIPNGFEENSLARARLAVRRRRSQTRDGLIRIGYAAGTRTHQRDFRQVAGVLGSILRERSDCRLVLFRHSWNGEPLLDPSEFASLRGLDDRIEWRNFVPHEDLPDEIARFDINIAPLEVNNRFCEAKSELKFVEAALVEVCTVASPTGPFRRAIRHRENGFLAHDAASWESILRRLIEDPALRGRVGRAAYRDVLWAHGPRRRVELAASMLEQILGDERTAANVFALYARSLLDSPTLTLPAQEPDVIFEADLLNVAEVTIAVPLYNYRQYVVEALESVAAQTLEQIDLVVVDDASTDDSLSVAETWMRANAARFNRLVLLRNPVNAGLARTRNSAFDMAETPFVLPLDADNRLLPEACAYLLDAIKDNGAVFVYPMLRQFGAGNKIMGKASYMPQTLVAGNTIDAMALIRKDCWLSVGGYADIRPQGWEDFDLWCRLAERGFWGRQMPRILAEYRLHHSSMLNSETQLPHNMAELIAVMQKRHPWLSLVHTLRDKDG